MKDMVFDFVLRATGGKTRVAEICASTVEDLDGGDVCIRLKDGEAEALGEAPEVVSFVGGDVDVDSVVTPFVVVGDLLYTRRNWFYERNVGDTVRRMIRNVSQDDVVLPDTDFYNRLRGEQRAAVIAMCKAQFSILTGGPGTGKTHTIARAVKYLQEANPKMRLCLAAPTGKAAARMVESMAKAGGVAEQAVTIHSLLGVNPGLMTVRHDKSSPLPCDWLIVDEASMIGLSMMSKLLDALPSTCRLTLVGDVDQLASVERGRVFGDLCRMQGVSLSRLEESARFRPNEDIARLANAVNAGRADDALALLKSDSPLVKYVDLASVQPFEPSEWPGFEALLGEKFAALRGCKTAAEALEHVNDVRILCAVRKGPYGVERMNDFVNDLLGRRCPVPMMITQNDRTLGVANGDVGVIMPGEASVLYVPGRDAPRSIRVELLPNMEKAFASTVHKSQGSEFRDVVMVLPPNGENPLLTREILYTGITRTKGKVYLHGGDESVKLCCERKVERVSGLS